MFIEEFVHHHGIHGFFGKGIRTNGASFTEDGRLEVKPYHSSSRPPHGCPLCPPNMCKGEVKERPLNVYDACWTNLVKGKLVNNSHQPSLNPIGAILDDLMYPEGEGACRAADKVIYVGDGGGDYCPVLRLR